jgi:chromosome segregation ATPase
MKESAASRGWAPLAALGLARTDRVDDWVNRNAARDRRRFVVLLKKGLAEPTSGQMREMATTEELNIRVGILANEVEGEKAVTRYAFEQVRLNTDELTAFRADARLRLDRISSDMALVKAAQIAQGGTLNILVQDVREIRQDMIALRRDMHARLDKVDARLDNVDARLDKVDARLDKVDARLDKVDARLDKLDARLDRLETRFEQMQESITAILAAVSPRNPPDGAGPN